MDEEQDINQTTETPGQGEDLTIPADSLGDTADPIATPPAQSEPSIETFTTSSQEELDQASQATQASEQADQDVIDAMFGSGTQEQQRADVEREAGIQGLSGALKDIRNEELTVSERSRREREAIQNDAALTAAQKSARLQDVGRKQNTELADIAVRKFVASNDLASAQAAVDSKLNLQFANQKANVEQLQFIAANLEGKEQKLVQKAAQKEERAYQQALGKAQIFANTQLAAMSNASLAGAGAGKIKQLNSAKNMEEFLAAGGGQYIVSPMDKLQLQKMNIDVANSNAQYQQTLAEIAKAQSYLEGSTGDATADIIAGSAQYGDKRLTDSQLEKIQQATNALGSIESLQSMLSLDPTGPIKGKKRQLMAALGGDADAKAINATIQGLIPTVARGIFGEVGVLTDHDIENYRKTVPNLNSTEDQNRLVSLVMYDVLSRTVQSTLVSNAQNQANVSNFLSTYQDVNSRIAKLKADLGVVDLPPPSPVNQAKMESAWSGGGLTPDAITSQLDNLMQ